MRKTFRNIVRAFAALVLVMAGLTIAAAPAQAHAPISYTADCPGTAVSQQLVVQTWSPDLISVTAWEDYPNGQIKPLGTAGPGDNGQVFYYPIQSFDIVRYDITSAGNLNYFYHVDCQYA